MEGMIDKLQKYQKIVQNLLLGYAAVKPSYGEIEVETVFDTNQNRYQIMKLGWLNKKWVHYCVMHLDIRDKKIWIFCNTTEHDIAADLVQLGVPKQDIILGFYSPAMRAMSDYGN